MTAGQASRRVGIALLGIVIAASVVPARAQAPADGDAIARIKAAGELVDGVEAASPPYEFDDAGTIAGFDIDLAGMFAKTLGVRLRVVDTAWDGVIPSLYARKFDLIWSAMPVTEPRKKAVLFSTIYSIDQPMLIARSNDAREQGIADLKGLRLGSQINSSVAEQSAKLSKDHDLDLDIHLYDHMDAAYLDLANHNLDVVMCSRSGFAELSKKRPGFFRTVLTLPPDLMMAVAARKQDPDLIQAVDRFLAGLQQSGQLTALAVRWFGAQPLPLPPAG